MRIEIPFQTKEVPDNLDTLFLTGELNIQLGTEICKELLALEYRNNQAEIYNPIQIIINSQGGDLYATWMITDIMAGMKTPIQTYGLGQVSSGAFIIFISGTKGKRIATCNTQFMSHRYLMAFEANHANIKSQQPELDRIHTRMINHYKKHTGLNDKDISKYLLTEHDEWLTAERCGELGICDVIINTSAITSKPKNKRIKVL